MLWVWNGELSVVGVVCSVVCCGCGVESSVLWVWCVVLCVVGVEWRVVCCGCGMES